VARYAGEHKITNFTYFEQFLSLAFAQLTYRESLRDIEACLRAQRDNLYHMGIRSRISRSTLADARDTASNLKFHFLFTPAQFQPILRTPILP
jgi:hypothetical protein